MVHSRTVMAGMPYPGCPVPLEVVSTGGAEEQDHWSWGLRFPRIGPQGVREKGWKECMTQTELWDAIKKCKANSDAVVPTFEEQNRLQTSIQVRRRCQQQGRAPAKKPMHAWNVTGQVNLAPVEGRWSTLAHCVVCVLDDSHCTDDIIAVLQKANEMGAKTVRLKTHDTTHIISFSRGQRFINLKNLNLDIIKQSWIHDCYKLAQETDGNARAIPLQPKYMMNMSPQTEQDFRHRFDQFGDNYFEFTTVSDMMDLLVDQSNPVCLAEMENPENFISEAGVRDLHEELDACSRENGVTPVPLAWSMFDGYKALMVDPFEQDDITHVSRLGLASACLIGGGGKEVAMGIHQHEKTHIVVDRGDKSSEEVLSILKERHVHWDDSVKIVDVSWVIDSFKEGRVLMDEKGEVHSTYIVRQI
jgi:hypothetical protein